MAALAVSLLVTCIESGYRVDFLPVFMPSNAPRAPGSVHRRYNIPLTEPFYVTTLTWKPRARPPGRRSRVGDGGGEYLTFWYVGQIAEDAVSSFGARLDPYTLSPSTIIDVGA